MTVQEVIDALKMVPPDCSVRAQFDISDHDTMWEVCAVVLTKHEGDDAVVIVVK